MAATAVSGDFVSVVSEEMSLGIDRALRYWLGRIELEGIDRSLNPSDRLVAIQNIIEEFKSLSGEEQSV